MATAFQLAYSENSIQRFVLTPFGTAASGCSDARALPSNVTTRRSPTIFSVGAAIAGTRSPCVRQRIVFFSGALRMTRLSSMGRNWSHPSAPLYIGPKTGFAPIVENAISSVSPTRRSSTRIDAVTAPL